MATLSHPKTSVIVPVYNAGSTIEKCLDSIMIQDYPDLEVVVVDDASSDDTLIKVSKYPARLITNSMNRGVSHSRNLGAENAASEILLFVDSDIVVPPNAVSQVIKSIMGKRDILAVGGVYSEKTRELNFISDFKNLDLAYRTCLCPDRVKYLGGYFLAVRKSTFLEAGGFSTDFFGSSVEDIEFGYRVTNGRNSMFIDRNIAVDHLKRYTLLTMLKTDFIRIINMVRIIKNSKGKNLAGEHAPAPYVANIFLSGLIILSLIVLPFFKSVWVSLLLITAFIVNNFDFARFLLKKRNVVFTVKSLFVLFIEYVVVGASLLISFFKTKKQP